MYLLIFIFFFNTRSKKRIPTIPEIVFQLISTETDPKIAELDRQRIESIRILSSFYEDPENIHAMTHNGVESTTQSNWEEITRDIVHNEELLENTINTCTIVPAQTEAPTLSRLEVTIPDNDDDYREYGYAILDNKPQSQIISNSKNIMELIKTSLATGNDNFGEYNFKFAEPKTTLQKEDADYFSYERALRPTDYMRPYSFSNSGRFDISNLEKNPYNPQDRTFAFNLGTGKMTIPSHEIVERAKAIQMGLEQIKNSSTKVDIKSFMHDVLRTSTHGAFNVQREDPLNFLDNIESVWEKQRKHAENSKMIDYIKSSGLFVDDVKDIPETLDKDSQKSHVLNRINEAKEKYELPIHAELDIKNISNSGGSGLDVQKSIEQYLWPGIKPHEEEDWSNSSTHIADSDVVPVSTFLSKVEKAFGVNPPPDVFNRGIISYIKSEHLRFAMHLLVKMKSLKQTPSEEAYTAVIEAFYRNFDVTNGDIYKNEMLLTYPNATPPSLTIVFE